LAKVECCDDVVGVYAGEHSLAARPGFEEDVREAFGRRGAKE
jgi:hypothetical protein